MRYASPDPREAYLLHNSPRWGLPLEGAPPTRARTRWHAASTCSDDCVPPAASACTRAPLASPRGPPIPELARWAHPSGVARHTRPRTLRSPGGPRACVWPPRRRRGRPPSRRSESWGCTSTSVPSFPKRTLALMYPMLRVRKRSQGVRRPSTYPYSPKCLEGVFPEVRQKVVIDVSWPFEGYLWECALLILLLP